MERLAALCRGALKYAAARERSERFRPFAQFGEQMKLAIVDVDQRLNDGQTETGSLFGIFDGNRTLAES